MFAKERQNFIHGGPIGIVGSHPSADDVSPFCHYEGGRFGDAIVSIKHAPRADRVRTAIDINRKRQLVLLRERPGLGERID